MTLLLINPNTSENTTARMVAIAQAAAPLGVKVVGATAGTGPGMIVDAAGLAASAREVVRIGVRLASEVSGVIVGAFGDPGVAELRAAIGVPVVGIAEAALREASGYGRFGIATVTPGLVDAITVQVASLGLLGKFGGVRLTRGDPVVLAGDPAALIEGLAEAVRTSFEVDRTGAVVIGGGPLGDAAAALAVRFSRPVIAPIPAAVRALLAILQ